MSAKVAHTCKDTLFDDEGRLMFVSKTRIGTTRSFRQYKFVLGVGNVGRGKKEEIILLKHIFVFIHV